MTNTRFIPFTAIAIISCLFVSSCSLKESGVSQTNSPKLSDRAEKNLVSLGMKPNAPITLRIFKEEGVLEVWKQMVNGKYGLADTFEICRWSGKLGPKFIEGDRQAPEGFYNVGRAQMNPNSQYHLSFDIGFPNAFDKANGRDGSHLMVHGGCSSAGCYSMTDEQIEEIWAYAQDAFKGGQKSFQVQAYPFRMTKDNMTRYRNDPNIAFWQNLKEGYDHFEKTKTPPSVSTCGKRYGFSTAAERSKACAKRTDTVSGASFLNFPALSYSSPKSPSIQGIDEAALVSVWSKRRARGHAVGPRPPEPASASASELHAAKQLLMSRTRFPKRMALSNRKSPSPTSGGKGRF